MDKKEKETATFDTKSLSIHDRLDLIETAIAAGEGIAGGIGALIDRIKHHVPTPAPTSPQADTDALSFTAFTNAMTQQAKDFGVAIDAIRSRLSAVESTINEIVSTLETVSENAEESTDTPHAKKGSKHVR